jgi:hypothetical protein
MRLDPDMPNEIPFESEKIIVPVETDCVPADTPKGVSAGNDADAVTMDELVIPNETLLLFEKMAVPVELICVPAETATGGLVSGIYVYSVTRALPVAESQMPVMAPV